jgi:hypothetical protein
MQAVFESNHPTSGASSAPAAGTSKTREKWGASVLVVMIINLFTDYDGYG